MKPEIAERVMEIADYVIKTKCTVRHAAKVFYTSKSTVQLDLAVRLPKLSEEKGKIVNDIMFDNWCTKHIKAGKATSAKWRKIREAKKNGIIHESSSH